MAVHRSKVKADKETAATEVVPAVTLDDVLRRRAAGAPRQKVGVIAIDVQGAGIDAANAWYARADGKASFADKLNRLFNAAAAPMPASAARLLCSK